MNAELTSGDHFAEVNPGDPLYRDLQLPGYNRRFVGTPDSVFVVDDTDQVVNAVDAVVASGKKLAVRSGGHGVLRPPPACICRGGRGDDRSCVPSAGYELGRDPARR